jgi:hypothetical protein
VWDTLRGEISSDFGQIGLSVQGLLPVRQKWLVTSTSSEDSPASAAELDFYVKIVRQT